MKTLAKVFFIIGILALGACSSGRRSTLESAEDFAVKHKAESARHLFLQVIHSSSLKDDIRYRALTGLYEISVGQTHRYSEAGEAIEAIIRDYEDDPRFKADMPLWRARASKIWRENLDNLWKAQEFIKPLKSREDLLPAVRKEIHDVSLALNDFDQAESHLVFLLADAESKKNCSDLKRLQIDFVHLYSLMKKCDKSLDWSHRNLPEGCVRDDYALIFERAMCLETIGETAKALETLSEAAQRWDTPAIQQKIAHLREREKRKQLK